MKTTLCECDPTTEGFCPRHHCYKTRRLRELCATEPAYFDQGERGEMPQQAEDTAFHCIHRGGELEEIDCASCGGHVRIKTFACPKHARCTIGKPLEAIQCCAQCPDRDNGARRFNIHNGQSVGDVAALSGALKAMKDRFHWRAEIDVRTSCAELWEGAPYVTPLAGERGPERAQSIDADSDRGQYATVHRCNERPVHQVEAYCESLSREIGEPFMIADWTAPSIFLTSEEKEWLSQVQEITGRRAPFWIVNSGVKSDYTAKKWNGFQEVIYRTLDHVTWAQIGEPEHRHEPLKGVIDLRGGTTLRELVRLVYHAAGVLCGVTGLMHLAHWVERGPLVPFRRHAVIIAGGREPPSWFAYPGHQIFHTIGELDCCASGGCWRSRVQPENDGDEKDESLCAHPRGDQGLCMEMIDPSAVAQTILRLCR
jgi:ADP-heptose:LPS heptosyltransferase